MSNGSRAVTACVGLVLTTAALARTPDGETPRAELACDGLAGSAFGLCVAWCEATDSAHPSADELRARLDKVLPAGTELVCDTIGSHVDGTLTVGALVPESGGLAFLGPAGLADVARTCHANTLALVSRLGRIRGVARAFSGAIFHEAVLRLPVPVAGVLGMLRDQRILGGFDLGEDYPELGNALLVCATETRTEDDIARYGAQLERILGATPRPGAGASGKRT